MQRTTRSPTAGDPFRKPAHTFPQRLTIGQIADAASVGVETVRYYQRRELLPVPAKTGAVRFYAEDTIRRIEFIKRAQSLGFSLMEISTLLDLDDGRDRRAIQAVTEARLLQVRTKAADLRRMRLVLEDLLSQCLTAKPPYPCPIIDALIRPAKKTG